MMNEDLKERRKKLGMTRRQLAKTLLITERTLLRWETGETKELHPLLRNAWMDAIKEAEQEARFLADEREMT